MPSLVDGLRQRISQVKDRRGNGRRYVLARSDDILVALQEGFTVKEIWRHLAEKGDICIQYDAFRVLVRKYVKVRSASEALAGAQSEGDSGIMAQKEAGSEMAGNGDREPRQAAENPRRTFKWNPRPKIEDFV